MSDDNIRGFERLVYKRNDCFINAIQLFGALDTVNANILRISSAGDTGFTEEQIERIFILKLGKSPLGRSFKHLKEELNSFAFYKYQLEKN
jgi:hypothetical protein